MVKVTEKIYKRRYNYVNRKNKASIIYADVEAYKRIKVKDKEDQYSLLETKRLIVTEFNLKRLKGDYFKITVILEWDKYGLI